MTVPALRLDHVSKRFSRPATLGDRIAVMDHGKLLQDDTPARILTDPATPFVRDLIGTTDRALRLLSLIPVADLATPGEAPGPAIATDATGRDALAECLWSGRDALPVQGGGIVTLDALRAQASRR